MVIKKWQKQIESAAYDLTHMEINTIIASEMTAAKSPSRPREMLHKIAGKYDQRLTELIEEYDLITSDTTQEQLDKLKGIVRESGYYSYKELQLRADAVEAGIRASETSIDKSEDDVDSDLAILHRIRRNSQEIKDILNETDAQIAITDSGDVVLKKKSDIKGFVKARLPQKANPEVKKSWKATDAIEKILVANKALASDKKKLVTKGDLPYAIKESRNQAEKRNTSDRGDLDLDLRQLSILKKAFDIGTSKVVMQTIIGLDGDITTRIAKSFADKPNQIVNEIHNKGIKISVDFWKTLINAIKQFGQTIVKTFK